ncbi:GTP-binding protein engB, partial [Lentithecium fluviatile CBS 122367]
PPTHTKIKPAALEDCNWYWETLPPTIAHKTQATHFFVGRAAPKFLRSVAQFRMFPDSDVPEVAFVGRSNVGKSSLLNAIVNADTKALLAKTSSTPGFTKTMNLYGVGPGNGVNIVKQPSGHDKIIGTGGLTIVDMPGYGEGSLSEWGLEIMKYVQERKQLRRVFILLDAEHGIKDKDRSLLASLRLGGIPHQIILSKLDKIYIPKADSIKRADGKKLSKQKPRGSLEALQAVMKEIRSVIQPPVGGGAIGEILGCSSEVTVGNKRLGIDAVRVAVLQAAGLE